MTVVEIIAHPLQAETITGNKFVSVFANALKSILNVTVVSGTTPSMTVKIEQVDPVSLTVIGTPVITHTAATGVTIEEKDFFDATARLLGTVLLITWTITGTTPSFTFNLTLIAKD